MIFTEMLHEIFNLIFKLIRNCNIWLIQWLNYLKGNLILAWIVALLVKVTTTQKVSVFGVFLVSIFPHWDWIRRNTKYPFVFSPKTGKYGPEKLWIRTLFMQWLIFRSLSRIYDHTLMTKKYYDLSVKTTN